MEQILKYSINYLDVMKDDNYIMVAKCRILNVDSDNYWHTIYTEEDVLKALPTLANKPILAIYKDGIFKSDFTDHARDKKDKKKIKVFGVIPETNEAKIVNVDGKKYLECIVCFWKYYNEEMVNKIAENSRLGKDTQISMEVVINEDTCEELENGCVRVKDFKFMGICCLGDDYTPAMDNANISVLKYSKTDYNKALKVANKVMKEYSMKGENKLLTNKQIREILCNALQDKLAEDDYSYLVDFDSEFIYVEDYKDGKTKRMPYVLDADNLVATVDVEDAKVVIKAGYVVVGEGEEPKTYAEVTEELSTCKQEYAEMEEKYSEAEQKCSEMEQKCSEKEQEYAEMEQKCAEAEQAKEDAVAKYSELETAKTELDVKYSAMETELNETVAKYSQSVESYSELKTNFEALTQEANELKEFKYSKEKEEKDAHAESSFAKYSRYFEDDVKGEKKKDLTEILYSKGVEEFDKEVSAYVLPKIEAENIAFQQNYSVQGAETRIFDYSIFPKVETQQKPNKVVPKDSFGRLKQYVEDSNE